MATLPFDELLLSLLHASEWHDRNLIVWIELEQM